MLLFQTRCHNDKPWSHHTHVIKRTFCAISFYVYALMNEKSVYVTLRIMYCDIYDDTSLAINIYSFVRDNICQGEIYYNDIPIKLHTDGIIQNVQRHRPRSCYLSVKWNLNGPHCKCLHFDGLVQYCGISSTLVLEIPQSCTTHQFNACSPMFLPAESQVTPESVDRRLPVPCLMTPYDLSKR